MSNFKIGDRVKILRNLGSPAYNRYVGRTATVDSIRYNGDVHVVFADGWDVYCVPGEIKLIKGKEKMGRRTFRAIKALPEIKKGAVVQEKCDDGDQDYIVLDEKFIKHENENGNKRVVYARGAVEQEPKFFEEVFPLTESWGTKEEQKAFKEFKKTQKKRK